MSNTNDTTSALSQAIEVLRKRIDRFGVAEPVIQSAGGNRILIQLPGLSQADKDSAKEQIQKTAFLEFRMVHERSAEIVDERTGVLREPVPLGYEVLKHVDQLANGQSDIGGFCRQEKTGERSRSATSLRAQWSCVVIWANRRLTLRSPTMVPKNSARPHATTSITGSPLFWTVTCIRHLIIQSAIETGNGQITGNYTDEQAMELANVLQNPLKAPLHIVYASDVDPTLGKDSIQSGINASKYAVIGVSGFMLIYYMFAGLAANVALVTNLIILLGVMCSIGTTFTLPGIAGCVLTVGMAVDANVLIYERIREELAKGKTLRGAIDAGYGRAFGTIFDSHVTTLISSIILIYMGTGEIKGFGVTLTIGVAASLFTALIVTRLIFNFMLDRGLIKSLHMLHIIRNAKVNFMAAAKPLAIMSCLFVVLSLGFGFTRGKKLFGVDFLGGDSTTYSFVQKPDNAKIRAVLRWHRHQRE